MLAAHVPRQSCDDLLELRIVRSKREGRAIPHQRLTRVATATGDVGQTANSREVLGGASEDALELGLRLVELIERGQRARQRDASRHVAGVGAQAGAAGFNCLLPVTGAAGKNSKSTDGGAVAATLTVFVTDASKPRSFVTVNVTANDLELKLEKLWLGVAPEPVVPSPKSQAYLTMVFKLVQPVDVEMGPPQLPV